MAARSVFLAASLAWFVACSGSVPPAPAPISVARTHVASDAGRSEASDPRVDGGAACLGSPLHAYETSPGVLHRIYVDLPIDGRPQPFFLDTGSGQSFLRLEADGGASAIAKETPTTISCIDVGFRYSRTSIFDSTPDGRPVGGTIGLDFLTLGGVFDLRIRDSLFVWSRTVPMLPPGTVTLPATFTKSTDPYSDSKLVVEGVALDGKPARLLVDTGSPFIVIVSSTPRANETTSEAIDGNGSRITLYASTIDVAYEGGPSRRMVVARAPSFPTLEKMLAAIGGGLDGILGLGALGHERIVIAKDAVRFVP